MSYLTEDQRRVLLAPIRRSRVSTDGKGHAHVESYEIRAHLSRIFGFARWSEEVTAMELVFEDIADGERPRYTICYRAQVRLTICAPDGTHLATYTEWATGEAINQPSRADAHDLALKKAESQALKRCAMNLGDSFGLSLYRRGSTDALVQRLVVDDPNAGEAPKPAEVDAHIQEAVPESDTVEAAPDTHTQSEPPKQLSDVDAKALRVADLQAQFLQARSKSQAAAVSGQMLKEGLANALTDDGQGNVCTLGALADQVLRKVTRAS